MGDKCVLCGSYRIKTKTISHYRVPRKTLLIDQCGEKRLGLMKPVEAILKSLFDCVTLLYNSDSRCGPLLVPALLTPVAIAEEDVLQLAAVLPTMAPIVGPSTTVVAIEGEPDLTTVDGRSLSG